MVSISPRLRDDLEYDDPESYESRLSVSYSSLLGDTGAYDGYGAQNDARLLAPSQDPSSRRKRRKLRNSSPHLERFDSFSYDDIAAGEIRLAIVVPGKGVECIECELCNESYSEPSIEYSALSYCWGSDVRDTAIICNGALLRITHNLDKALKSVRKPNASVTLWIDQICIDQENRNERAHQVSILKHIYTKARNSIVWLGEEEDRSAEVFQYAEHLGRGEGASSSRQMNSLLSPHQRKMAIKKLFERPWFSRVWTIQEVALAKSAIVACGTSRLSWDNLVRLVKGMHLAKTTGFDKATALLGNPRQRIAILTQMAISQRAGHAHADITQLLILAKGSKSSEPRDMVYAFYGLTHITTFPDYLGSVEKLYTELTIMYVTSILWEASFAKCHNFSDQQRTQQLMSILYSAGTLAQPKSRSLPSWVPDWEHSWHVAPLWCRPIAKSSIAYSPEPDKNTWTAGIRSPYRAGGDLHQRFEVVEHQRCKAGLKVTAKIFDTIVFVSKEGHAPAMFRDEFVTETSTAEPTDLNKVLYGRVYFRTMSGMSGVAVPGVQVTNWVAILLGGDVPVVLQEENISTKHGHTYRLVCECYIRSNMVMQGGILENPAYRTKDIILL